MKQQFIINERRERLLLFFAGWGMDETPFLHIYPKETDWMVCSDYRTLDFDDEQISQYKEITVIGWSMGVWAAAQVMQKHPELPIKQRIAINGTLFPIHETLGIAPAIYEGTLQRLNEVTLQKFQRRMCGSSTAYRSYLNIAPMRSIESLKEELVAIRDCSLSTPTPIFLWEKAIIGKMDRIFSPENQERAWSGRAASLQLIDAPHYQTTLIESTLTNYE